MARHSVPSTPKIRSVKYDNLLGVDFQNDATEISRYRSPDMVNMISDLGGNPVKRYGYRSVGGAYEGVVQINGLYWAVKPVSMLSPSGGGKALYAYLLDISGENISEQRKGRLSSVNYGTVKHIFGFQNKLYVLCDNEWIEYNTDTNAVSRLGVSEGTMYDTTDDTFMDLNIPEDRFIPTVYTMYKPNGQELVTLPEGTDLTGATQGVNVLTPFRRVEYCVTVDTGEETVFTIPNTAKFANRHDNSHAHPFIVEILDSGTFEWKKLTEGTDFTASDNAANVLCTDPDGTDSLETRIADAKVRFVSGGTATPPYKVVTENNVKYLRFRDDDTKAVPAGVPNVRITYAPFAFGESNLSTKTDSIEVTPSSSAAGFNRGYAGGTATFTIPTAVKGAMTLYARLLRLEDGAMSARNITGTLYFGYTYTQTVSFFGGTLTVSYDGVNTVTCTASGVSGDKQWNIEINYATGEPTQYELPANLAIGTNISVEVDASSGTVSDVYNATFTVGTRSYYRAVAYKGDNTLKFSISPSDDGRFVTPTIRSVTYTIDAAEYGGYYKENRTNILKAEATAVHDARLFAAEKNRTRYSRASEFFCMDDNFYFDVDNKIKLYAKTSSALAVIAEDTGQNVIYLAQGEYDSNLAMQVYSVKASNAGVGAISSKVSGVLNDEPIFLSRTGLYGITTNYYSEKYSVARSGKINRRMCAEPNLENAVGASYNGYFYLAVNGHMYVLDSRHKDQSRNGDNSYECYYFEDMPNITDIFVINNRMFFSDGTNTYTWNDAIPSLMHYDVADGATKKPVKCRWTSMLDNDGVPNYYKVLNKKGTYVTLSPPMQTSCEVTIIKDAHDRIYAGRFDGSTFALSDSVLDGFTKKKIKKYKRLQFVVENNEAEPFGILSIVKSFTVGNLAKR